jgi:hypothetical protein
MSLSSPFARSLLARSRYLGLSRKNVAAFAIARNLQLGMTSRSNR